MRLKPDPFKLEGDFARYAYLQSLSSEQVTDTLGADPDLVGWLLRPARDEDDCEPDLWVLEVHLLAGPGMPAISRLLNVAAMSVTFLVRPPPGSTPPPDHWNSAGYTRCRIMEHLLAESQK